MRLSAGAASGSWLFVDVYCVCFTSFFDELSAWLLGGWGYEFFVCWGV